MRLFKRTFFFLIILTLLGGFLRFYNLNWGEPYYFHPDERNIASSVTQLHFPNQMNPKFFAYGSLPIYTIYATAVIKNIFAACITQPSLCKSPDLAVSFADAIIISRIFSALFSTLLIALLFKIGNKMQSQNTGRITAFLATTSVGFIQFAHFGTFEMWITFFATLLLWVCLHITKQRRTLPILASAIIYGILISIKVSNLTLFILPVLTITKVFYSDFRGNGFRGKTFLHALRTCLLILFSSVSIFFIASVIFLFTNPYTLIDFTSFHSSITYESNVALGLLPVFYTQGFFQTIPIVFQLLHIYPFLINPFLTVIFIPSFFYLIWKIRKTGTVAYVLLVAFYLVLFLSQAFFFVKWTRYIMPTLPFVYLIIAIAVNDVFVSQGKKTPLTFFKKVGICICMLFCSLFTFAYFLVVLMQTDPRVLASAWARTHISHDSKIVSEVFDLGIVPFNENFHNITLLNFYELDSHSPELIQESLAVATKTSDYIILPGSRIFTSRFLQKNRFPLGHIFYTDLFSGRSGYNVIYATSCDLFCKILYLGNPNFSYEQTANVFDRPTVYIFKKNI